MIEKYQLDKTLWTDADFEIMGWHDARIHAISFDKDFQIILDIDYIFEWVHPKKGEIYFKFWISPCTLVFENVFNLNFDLELNVPSELYIDAIVRSNSKPTPNGALIEHHWQIESDGGRISFKATGYKQYVRIPPQLVDTQELDVEVRGGNSFSSLFSPRN